MINVTIIENNGLVALCSISGDPDEFREDLALIKKIPFKDREFVPNAEKGFHETWINPFWRVRNAEKYANQIVEIGDAIRVHKAQLKLF